VDILCRQDKAISGSESEEYVDIECGAEGGRVTICMVGGEGVREESEVCAVDEDMGTCWARYAWLHVVSGQRVKGL